MTESSQAAAGPTSASAPGSPGGKSGHVSSAELSERLNTGWRVAGIKQVRASLGRRLLYSVRLVLSRLLRPQETFNSTVVQHINILNASMTLLRDRMLRVEADVRSLRTGHEQLTREHARNEEARSSLAVLQREAQNLRREVRRLAEAGTTAMSETSSPSPVASPQRRGALDSHKYVGFEDQFRGRPEDIRARLSEYVPLFKGRSAVLDVGCGRGEFLALLRDHGVSARGVDVNETMVEACREQGLAATAMDALTYLQNQDDESIGGLFAAQVIEHLDPDALMQFLDLAREKLQPGAPIVLETINPACWFAFFDSYIRDLTHVRPIHPETLKYLLIASGYQQVEIAYRMAYPQDQKLQSVSLLRRSDENADLDAWAVTLNENAERLNRLLFTWLDYAAIGRRV